MSKEKMRLVYMLCLIAFALGVLFATILMESLHIPSTFLIIGAGIAILVAKLVRMHHDHNMP